MSQHHPHDHDKHHHHKPSGKRPIHHDWRLWLGVVLACAAMLFYVMSDDEALQPGGGDQAPMPAAE